MMNKAFIVFALIFCCHYLGSAQESLSVLRSSSDVVSIQDGDILRQDYWYLDPSLAIDVYVADRAKESKKVAFYSDIDTIVFELAAGEAIDFYIIFAGKDSCLTRVQSGITFSKNAQSPAPPDTIPFRLNAANNMIVETVLNDQDSLQLMFHLANGSINLTEEAVQKLQSITMDQNTSANSWGGENEARYSQHNSLQIGETRTEGLTIWQDKLSGPETDGKFGPDFFDNRIIEIDYDKSYLVIHDERPVKADTYLEVPLSFNRNLMFVEAQIEIEGIQISHKLMLHTGFGGALLLDDAFVSKHQLGSKLEIIDEQELRDSYGNIIKTKKAILPSMTVGGKQFEKVPIGFFEGALGRQRMSVIGGETIKRFNLIIDLQRAELYMQANSLGEFPFSIK